ncbi:MAG: hypothetical protein FWF38_03820 [Spirochaetaceae bacterium]|nr:hypothetical protein [Spirochaetaceae bacterium]
MELNKKEKILLYAFLKKHEKELEKELYTLKYRLEKEVFDSLTIEEIQVLDKSI